MKPDTDDYPTCAEAYATLRMYHSEEAPEAVSAMLCIEPNRIQRIGDRYTSSNITRAKKINGWFLESEGAVSSFDIANHLLYLLDRLSGKEEAVQKLIASGWKVDIACMWDSAYGHGGPTLSPDILRRLASLGIEVWFDVYFHGAYALLKKEKEAFGGR